MVKINLPLYIPRWVYLALRKVKGKLREQAGSAINLSGDREIEWSFIITRLSRGPGEVLDFGASFGNLSIAAAQRGFHVLALDLAEERFPWKHPTVEFMQSDLLKADLPERYFDYVLNCSSVEHVGLQGRYGVEREETDADLKAMKR